MADNLEKEERANFHRLATLLVDVGSKVLRNVLQEVVKPNTVEDVLKTERSEIDKYYKGNPQVFKKYPKILNDKQYALLTVSLNPMEFDITLLVFIFRNVCRIAPPKLGWKAETPAIDDVSLAANIQRLQEKRNVIYGHIPSIRIERGAFENTWNDLSNIIRRIAELQSENFDVEINELKCQSLDPCDKTDILLKIIKDWQEQDELYKAEVIGHLQRQEQYLKEIHSIVVGNAEEQPTNQNTIPNQYTDTEQYSFEDVEEDAIKEPSPEEIVTGHVSEDETGGPVTILGPVEDLQIGDANYMGPDASKYEKGNRNPKSEEQTQTRTSQGGGKYKVTIIGKVKKAQIGDQNVMEFHTRRNDRDRKSTTEETKQAERLKEVDVDSKTMQSKSGASQLERDLKNLVIQEKKDDDEDNDDEYDDLK